MNEWRGTFRVFVGPYMRDFDNFDAAFAWARDQVADNVAHDLGEEWLTGHVFHLVDIVYPADVS